MSKYIFQILVRFTSSNNFHNLHLIYGVHITVRIDGFYLDLLYAR